MTESVVEELARKRIGRTIKGKWRLDRLLGVGGMAAVYAATHRNGARVAIKMLHATVSVSSNVRARFVREGYLANKVDHPGVVRVLDDDVDDSDQAAFLVMDLVLGQALSDRGMERLLDDREIIDVTEQVLSVLASAHEKGIIHRDLKPDNLLVDANGKVHVLDFGIARLLEEGSLSSTKTGTAFGTPGYMAPEQALGKTHKISPKTDLYALGATLFALASGDFVHAAENAQELMILVATQPPRSLAECAPQLHGDVIALVDKATKSDLAERWGSAEEMLVEVRRLKTTIGHTPVVPMPRTEVPRVDAPPIAPIVDVESVAPVAPAMVKSDTPMPASDPRNETTRGSVASVAPAIVPPRRKSFVPVAIAVGVVAFLGGVVIVVTSQSGKTSVPAAATPTVAPTLASSAVAPVASIEPAAALIAPAPPASSEVVVQPTPKPEPKKPLVPAAPKIGGVASTTIATTATSTVATPPTPPPTTTPSIKSTKPEVGY